MERLNMGFHLPQIVKILWILLFLDYAAAVTQTLSASTLQPNPNIWTSTNGRYVSSQSGDAAYVDFVFNQQGEQYVTLSVNAYGYTGSPTSPAPASYTIQINGINHSYGGDQQQPVVFSGLEPTFQYRVVVWAPSSASGVIVNSVVVSRPDPPATSTSTHPITSALPSTPATVASTADSSSLSASSLSSNPAASSLVASTATSTGTANATSISGQSLGLPIFVTISGSVVPQESQTNALISASSDSSSSPSIGIILGPIAGVIAVMIIAAFIFIRRRNQARRRCEQSEVDSYLVEEESQQRSPSIETSVVAQSPMVLEKSRALFYGTNQESEGGSSRETTVASATAHTSYITTITDSTSSARAFRDPFASLSRMSMSSIEDEIIAPPAYVEEERNTAARNDRL